MMMIISGQRRTQLRCKICVRQLRPQLLPLLIHPPHHHHLGHHNHHLGHHHHHHLNHSVLAICGPAHLRSYLHIDNSIFEIVIIIIVIIILVIIIISIIIIITTPRLISSLVFYKIPIDHHLHHGHHYHHHPHPHPHPHHQDQHDL